LNVRQQLGLETLEPRILLDAAAVVTGAEMAMDVLSQQDSQDAVDMIFGVAPRDEMQNAPEADLSPALLAELDKIVDAFAPHQDRFDLALENGKERIIPISEVRDPLVDADRVGEFFDAGRFENASALTSIVFVDSGVTDYKSLLSEFGDDVEVVVLSSDTDGVEQIASYLKNRSELDAIHIISHGRSGSLDLGDTQLTEASIAGDHADEMAIIRSAMSETGDILIYGCDFGAGMRGVDAVNAFALATGADVAASNDDTGAADLGGNWILEINQGKVDVAAFNVLNFGGILADTDGDGVDDSVDIDDDNDGILDSVEGATLIDGFTIGTTVLSENGDGSGSFNIPVLDSLGVEVGSLTLNYSGFTGDGNTGGNGSNSYTPTLNIGQVGTDVALQLVYALPDINGHNFAYSITSNGLDFTDAEHNVQGQALTGGGQPGRVESGAFTIDHTLSNDPVSLLNGGGVNTIDGISLVAGQTLENGDEIIKVSSRNPNRLLDIGFDIGNGETYGVDVLHNNGRQEGIEVTTFVLGTSVSAVGGVDSDGDGVLDHLDLDSDNDGIPDNVEAQTSVGYIAPNADANATYATNNGLNSAYVGTNGLTPVNTDNDADADYLDTDSDNEGGSDAAESGVGASTVATGLSDVTTDADGDGLFDVFENGSVNDGFITNDGLTPASLADSDNDAASGSPLTADFDYRDAQFDVPPLDTDGDGVADFEDIDDDNDGILDMVENPGTAAQNATLPFDATDLPNPSRTYLNIGGTTLDATLSHTSPPNVSSADFLGPDVWTLFAPGGIGSESEVLFDFAENPVDAINFSIIHINGNSLVGGDEVEIFATTDQGTILTNPILTPQSSTPSYIIAGNVVSANGGLATQADDNVDVSFDATNIPTGERIVSVTVLWRDVGGFAGSHGVGFQNLAIVDNGSDIGTLDSDGDGILNYLDLDSDNDGIADNIEAQSTAGYIAPSGVGAAMSDMDGDGLDDRYDATPNGTADGAGSNGLTPVNTDGQDLADYLDTDSDNEGGNDTTEAGLTSTAIGLSTAANDADGDGLFDVFETQGGTTASDGFDVNESLITGAASFPDIDGDAAEGVPLTADVDFRDTQDDRVDTDGDGVFDVDDIDDDNDGILDVDEGLSFNLIPNGNVTRVGNVWTYASVAMIDGRTFDLRVEEVQSRGTSNFSLSANTSLNATNWNPRQGHYVILEYTLIDQATGDPVEIDAFRFVTGDIDGQSFGQPVTPNRAWEIVGFESAEVDSIQFNTSRLGYRGFLNGASTPAGYATIRQGTPSNVSGTGNDVSVQYTNTSSFRVLYGVTGGQNNENSVDRNFFFRRFEGVLLQRDTDNDGVADHLDIDSDNDGITDNIEAQTTAGYIAPSGVGAAMSDMDGDGLDDRYDATPNGTADGAGSNGLTPVNSDSGATTPDTTPDYLDTDSDNDGTNDADEAGHGESLIANGTLSTAGNDADGDGLFDVFETALDGAANDGFVVNEGISPLDGTLRDGGGDASIGTATPLVNDLDFRDLNDDPIANDDGTFAVTGGAATTFNLLSGTATGEAADTDPDSDTLSITQIIDPADAANPIAITTAGQSVTLTSGTIVVVNGNGTVTVTTPLTATGTETFDYTVSDGNGGTDSATVTLNRTSGNTPPVAVDDALTGDENTTTNVDLFAANTATADGDPENDTFTVTRVASGNDVTTLATLADGTGVTTVVAGSNGGAFTVAANGTASFDPNGEFDNLATGESRITQIVYQIDDGRGGTDTAVVTYTVTGVNDIIVPQIPGDPNVPADRTDFIPDQTGVDGTAATTLDLATFFTDPDSSDVVSFSVDPADLPPGLSLTGTTISGTLNPDASQGGTNGVYDIPVTVTDSNGDSFVTTIQYTVTNPAPIAENDTLSGLESDIAASFDVFAANTATADSDPDGDTFTVTRVVSGNDVTALAAAADGAGVAAIIAGSMGGEFTVNADGTASFNANGDFGDLAAGETRVTEIVYQIDDGNGGTDTAVVSYTVTGENDLIVPQIPGDPNVPADRTDFIPDQTGTDNLAATTLDLNTFFSDPDTSDAVSFSVDPANLPAGLSLVNGVISGTLDNSASQGGTNGVYNIDVTVTDGNGDTFVTTVQYTITNPAPTAADDSYNTPEDTPITVNVITDAAGADIDPDGDDLSVDAAALADGTPLLIGTVNTLPDGDLTIAADGTVAFDPAENFNGDFIFGYTVTDSEGGTNAATVTITVDAVNDAPNPVVPGDPNPPADPLNYIPAQTAQDSAAITPLDLTPYFNDVDGDPLTLTIAPADLPDGLSFDGTSISGTPDADASQGGTGGVYTIPVVVTDGNGGTFTTNVTYTITNPAPTAVADNYNSPEDGTISGNVINDAPGTDTDPDGDMMTISLVDGDAANIGTPTAGDNGGQFTIDANGDILFDANGEFEGLDDGETAVITITYQVSDGEGGTSDTTVIVSVQGANDAPVVTGTLAPQNGIDAIAQLPFDASIVFSDVDANDVLSFSSLDLPSWMTLDADTGIITGTPPSDASVGGPLGDGVYTVTIVGSDGDESVSTTVTYTFVNPAPVAEDDAMEADEDTVTSFNAFAMNPTMDDSDPDGDIFTATRAMTGNDVTALAALADGTGIGAAVAGSMGGAVTLQADGTAVFNPNGEFDDLAVGESRVTEIVYQIDDGEGGTDTAVISYTVTGVNDTPIPVVPGDPNLPSDDQNYIPSQTGVDNGPVTALDLTPYFGDPDVSDVLTLTVDVAELPPGLSFDGTSITGTLDPSASQGGPNGDGIYSVTVTADDGNGGTFSTEVVFTVTNPAPVVDTPVGPIAAEDAEGMSIQANISDPDGDTLTYSVTGLPTGLSIDTATGEITGVIDNSASQAGPNGDGIYTVVVTADDGEGGTVTDTFELTVTNPIPDAVDDVATVTEDAPVTGNVMTDAGTDTDLDGDDLVVSMVGGDAANVGTPIAGTNGGLFTINPDGSYTFDPNGDFEGLDVSETALTSITYQISDGEGGFDVATLEVTVTGENDAPIPLDPTDSNGPADPNAYIPAQSGTDNVGLVDFDTSPFFDDVDGEPLTFSSPDLPSWMSIDASTGIITGTPPADASQGGPNGDGVYPITVTVTDPDGENFSTVVEYSFENPAPIAEDNDYLTPEETPISGNIIADDSDPDGDTLSVDAVSLADGTAIALGTTVTLPEGELTVNSDGTFDFTPALDFNGDLVLGYVLSDGEGGTDIGAVTITVTPVNDAPVIGNPLNPPADPNAFIPPTNGVDGQPLPPLNLPEYFSDVDGDDLVLTLNENDLPPGLSFDGTNIVGTADSSASQGGPNGDGIYSIVVTATDPDGETVSTTLTITISNPGPIAVNDGTITVLEDTPTVIDVLSNDTDPDGDDLTVTEVAGQPISVGNPVTLPSGGIVSLGDDGKLIYTPPPGESGDEVFSYTLTDADGASDEGMVSINTAPVNDPPGLTGEPLDPDGPDGPLNPIGVLEDQSNVDGESITPIDVSTGFDDPEGDVLTYSGEGLPPGLSIDPTTGIISGTLPSGASKDGPYTVTITAADPGGLSVATDFVWEVENLPPLAQPMTEVNVQDGESLSVQTSTSFNDPDGDELSYTAEGLPSGLSINPSTGEITGTLGNSASQSGPYVVTVTTTDADGSSAETTVEIIVTNPPPLVEDVRLLNVVPGQDILINIADVSNDPDGDQNVTYSAPDLPPGLTLDPQTGQITGTPNVAGEQVIFTVLVDDNEGGVSEVVVTLDVSEDDYNGDDGDPFDHQDKDETFDTGIDDQLDGRRDSGESLNALSASHGDIDLTDWFDKLRTTDQTLSGHHNGEASFLGGVAKVTASEYGAGAELWVEAVATRHALTLQLMESISQVSDVSVKSWDVTLANGMPLPAGVDYARGLDLLTLNRSAVQSDMELRVRALLDNGRTISLLVDVDLHHGVVEHSADNAAIAQSSAQTLDQQLQLAASDIDGQDAALMKALAG
jgi:hypothetical protein